MRLWSCDDGTSDPFRNSGLGHSKLRGLLKSEGRERSGDHLQKMQKPGDGAVGWFESDKDSRVEGREEETRCNAGFERALMYKKTDYYVWN